MDEQPEPPEVSTSDQMRLQMRRLDRVFQVMSAVMLGLVALATAWSGYQAARWSGVQATAYIEAASARVESSQASTQAGQLIAIDLSIFSNWLNAYAANNTELADFYQQRFRDEFVPAFDAWVATQPRTNPEAPPSPFAMPEYRLAASEEAAAAAARSDELFQEGQAANDQSDRYVLNTVILASVLFFLAVAERFEWLPVKLIVILIALGLLLYGIITMATYPIQ